MNLNPKPAPFPDAGRPDDPSVQVCRSAALNPSPYASTDAARSLQFASDLRSRTFDRILLIKPSSLGDVVHALPVLHGLRARYPQARIDWLIASSFKDVLEATTGWDELVCFDRARYGRIGRSPGATRDFIRFIRDLRKRRYDLVIDIQGLFRTGFLSWVSGAPVRIGFRGAREGASMFYTHRLHAEDPDMHAVERNYLVSKMLGFEEVPIQFNLAPVESARREARALLRDHHLEDAQPLIAVVPGARWETKRWLPERFAETMDTLHERGVGRCVLLGAPDEISLCERIVQRCRTAPANLAGQTSLRLLPAVIQLADLVLCQDSAVMHVAVALQRPLVCLIGPTNAARTGPYGRPDDVVRVELSCSPCYLRKQTQCPYQHRCMVELESGTVVSAVQRALRACSVLAGG